ncbi:MAG: T9SS type A sorting domain-containing protein, partial [Bacteroidia bacterium]
SNGWVVGDSGRIYMTNNAGVSWTIQTANTTQKINGVHFPNDSAGWCVANFGAIRKLALITVDVNESVENPFALSAFPNPSNDQNVNLNFTLQNNEDVTIEIFDATGRLIQSINYPFNAGRKGFDQTISNIALPASGIYIVRITQGNLMSQVRLIRN